MGTFQTNSTRKENELRTRKVMELQERVGEVHDERTKIIFINSRMERRTDSLKKTLRLLKFSTKVTFLRLIQLQIVMSS